VISGSFGTRQKPQPIEPSTASPLRLRASSFSIHSLGIFDASVPEEERLAIIGHTLLGKLLFVVNLEETNDFVRILSARPAESADLKI